MPAIYTVKRCCRRWVPTSDGAALGVLPLRSTLAGVLSVPPRMLGLVWQSRAAALSASRPQRTGERTRAADNEARALLALRTPQRTAVGTARGA